MECEHYARNESSDVFVAVTITRPSLCHVLYEYESAECDEEIEDIDLEGDKHIYIADLDSEYVVEGQINSINEVEPALSEGSHFLKFVISLHSTIPLNLFHSIENIV